MSVYSGHQKAISCSSEFNVCSNLLFIWVKTLGKPWCESGGKPGPNGVWMQRTPLLTPAPGPLGQAAEEPSLFTERHQIRSVMQLARRLLLWTMLSRKPIKVLSFDILTHGVARMLLCGFKI